MELMGHTDNAEFAMGMCTAKPLVASGGKDSKGRATDASVCAIVSIHSHRAPHSC